MDKFTSYHRHPLVSVKDVLHEILVFAEEVRQEVDEQGHELGREGFECHVGLHPYRRHFNSQRHV